MPYSWTLTLNAYCLCISLVPFMNFSLVHTILISTCSKTGLVRCMIQIVLYQISFNCSHICASVSKSLNSKVIYLKSVNSKLPWKTQFCDNTTYQGYPVCILGAGPLPEYQNIQVIYMYSINTSETYLQNQWLSWKSEAALIHMVETLLYIVHRTLWICSANPPPDVRHIHKCLLYICVCLALSSSTSSPK